MKYLLYLVISIVAFSFSTPAQVLRVGQSAPQFAASDLGGTNYELSQMKGKVVVVTFWSTRCLICKSELPKVNQMIRGYDGKDVIFLAVTADDASKVQPYLQKNPQSAHVIPNGFGLLLAYADKDPAGNLNFGYPAFYVIDREGRLAYKGSGWDRVGPLSSTLNSLLGK